MARESWQTLAHEVIVWAEEDEDGTGKHCRHCGAHAKFNNLHTLAHREGCLIARLRARAYGPPDSQEELAAERMLAQIVNAAKQGLAAPNIRQREEGKLGPMEVDQE